MNQFAIYTAVIGGYDNVLQPTCIDPRFDYILFSNDISEGTCGTWRIRRIPYSNPDPTRIARWVKTHPEVLLPNYSASVWIDGNVIIKTAHVYERIIELLQSNILIASMWHNERNCVYKEAEKLITIGWEQEHTFLAWTNKIWKEHYPTDKGLWETNFLFRVHSNNRIQNMDHLWWNCIDNYSRRDQLSFPYVLWKTGIECPYFLSECENVRNSSHFEYVYHDTGKSKRLPVQKNTIAHYYTKLYGTTNREHLTRLYRSIYTSSTPRFKAFLVQLYYRIKCAYIFYLYPKIKTI